MIWSTYPKKDEYNKAWEDFATRLTSIREQLEFRLREQQQYSNLQVADRQALQSTFDELEEFIALQDAKSGNFREVKVETFSSGVGGLGWDAKGKYLTLPVASLTDIRLGRPEIIDSNGLPGNWAEAQQFSQTDDGRISAVVVFGNQDPSAAVDEASETHFEYERCIVDPIQETNLIDEMNGNISGQAKKHVLEIIRPDPWEVVNVDTQSRLRAAALPEEFSGPLKLTLRIPVIDSEMTASSIELTPYLPVNQFGKSPFRLVKAVAIGDSGKILLDRVFVMDRIRSLRIPASKVRYLELTFQQEGSYSTKLAHHYWEELIVTRKDGKALFGVINLGKAPRYAWNRIADPSKPLGVIDSKAGTLLQNIGFGLADAATAVGSLSKGAPWGMAVSAAGQAFGNLWYGLVGQTKTTVERQAVRENWEIFTGKRYAMGLTDLKLRRVIYDNAGVGVLGPYQFAFDLRHVSIHPVLQLPDEGGASIQFEFSTDQETWTPINPDEVMLCSGREVWVRVTMERGELDHVTPLLHEVRVYGS